MHRRERTMAGLVCAFIVILIDSSLSTAAPSGQPPLAQAATNSSNQPAPPGVEPPWLDEVRAQRQAWEARRHETREAYEARRRLHNPQSAARQEAWQEDVRRQRAEHLERIERDRENFGDPGSSWFPWPWPDHPSPPFPLEDQTGNGFTTPSEPFPPPDWDNLWYFRGY